MTNKLSSQISAEFRMDFREFCVIHLTLRNINDCFSVAGVTKSQAKIERPISGERRQLVEEYYASLDWSKDLDAEKFLRAIQYVYIQSYLTGPPRTQLEAMLQLHGYEVKNAEVRRVHDVNLTGTSVQSADYFVDRTKLTELHSKLLSLNQLSPQERGFALERLLNEMFSLFELKPRQSFRLVGEQIDGSFELEGATYLLEAKWLAKPVPQADLLIFREKVESKSAWSRGLFISESGFSTDGLAAFARGRSTNIVGMNGFDLLLVLSGDISLQEAIKMKVRHAAETGEFFTSLFELLRSQ